MTQARSTTPSTGKPGRDQFDALAAEAMPKLRGVIRRMVGNPDDTNDLVQDSLLRAYEKFSSFRGDSSFSTWLVSIGTRAALNHLRSRKQWRWDAQIHIARQMHGTDDGKTALKDLFSSPQHRFDAREHIAFCFTCVGRSLTPDHNAALVLRDVLGYSNREAAKILGLSESVLRHRLGDARKTMIERFDGLCGIVSKKGVCYQCEGLRNTTAAEHRGPEVPKIGSEDESSEERYRVRLTVLQDRDIDDGQTQMLHDLVWRAMTRHEANHADSAAAP